MSSAIYSTGSMGMSPLSDPTGSSAILAATQWISQTLLGSLAAAIAVIAIGWVGLLMLSGRIDLRRGVTVVLGCFILFGAPTIARGLRGFGDDSVSVQTRDYSTAALPSASPTQLSPQQPPPNPYDPYAGASLGQ